MEPEVPKVMLQARNKSKTSITSWTQNMSWHDKAKKKHWTKGRQEEKFSNVGQSRRNLLVLATLVSPLAELTFVCNPLTASRLGSSY
jgi:hypothetical protein